MIEQNTEQASKNASSTKTSRSELNKNRCTLVKGPKPLLKFKFYLDIKNHAVTSKLEGKIKDLGGVIEFFLVKEVTHVITDREICAGAPSGVLNSPLTPQFRSVESQGTNESPGSGHGSTSGGSLRQKTRADAMLEKVRSQSTSKCTDPLQNAKQWGIPIWTVNKVFSWLEKVSASITVVVTSSNNSVNKAKKVKLISIKTPFLKYEPFTRDARPVYKSFQSWPIIDLDSTTGKPAFLIKTNSTEGAQNSNVTETKVVVKKGIQVNITNDSRMTRKQRTRLSVRNKEQEVEKQTTLVGGFCEICHCEYREIGEHVRSEQHLNFVKNDANFLELDTLISAGANVEAFLRLNGNTGKDLNNYPLFGRRSLRKLNGKNTPDKCNGSHEVYSPPVTRNKMPRTRTSSNHSPLSPTGSDSGHHLRSKGQLWLPPNLLGTTAEDEPFSNKAKDSSKHDRKSSCRFSEDEAKITKENDAKQQSFENSGRPKRTCPKTKRISADERLVADNKTYYKVEVMTTKLRSSGLGHREHELARRTQTPIPEESDNSEQGLVVKFKRVRRSELSVLNDEAENFMFPRKDDPSLSDIDTDEAPNTTRSTIKSESTDIKSSSEVDTKSLLRCKGYIPNDRLDDIMTISSITSSESEIVNRRDSEHVTRRENESLPRRRRTRNDTRLDLIECEESHDTNSVANCEVENVSNRRRRTTRRDTKCEPIDLEESNDVDSIDNYRRRTRNDTKYGLTILEDSNDVDSVDTFENGRRRRTRNDTKCELADLEESDASSEVENIPKRKRMVKQEPELEESKDVEESTVPSCQVENSLSRKRRRVKSENLDVDENSVDNCEKEMELRRKRRKIYSEIDEHVQLDESSVDDSTACDSDIGNRRKKRRTQAEAFIADNQKYYRFETPGSRLRYQGAFLQKSGNKTVSTSKNNGQSSDEKRAIPVDGERPRMPKDNLKFSFELLPKSEPWYCTFQRQDKGEEYYTCVSDPGYRNRFYLPYQFPYLIPLDPQVCIAEYHRKKEFYIKSEAAKLDMSIDSPAQSVDSPAPSESITEKSNESDKPLSELQIVRRKRKRKEKRFLKVNSNHPRKSPRQHASTLAILSSLIQQRKRRERKSNGESDTSRTSLVSIPEENIQDNSSETPAMVDQENQSVAEADNSELNSAMEEMLTATMDDISDIEFYDVPGIEIKDKPDAIDLLENYNKFVPFTDAMLEYQTPLMTETVRVVRRKRKKNRTGWPKKKRLFTKRSEIKSEDGNVSILELEDSRLTELSVGDESGELELCDGELEDTIEVCDSELHQRTEINKSLADDEQSDASKSMNKVSLVVNGVTNSKNNCKTNSVCELTVYSNSVSTNSVMSDSQHSSSSCGGEDIVVKKEADITANKIQGVLNCTDRINSVLRDANSVKRNDDSEVVVTDNNNSVTSDKLADSKVKTNRLLSDIMEKVDNEVTVVNNSSDEPSDTEEIHQELASKSNKDSDSEEESVKGKTTSSDIRQEDNSGQDIPSEVIKNNTDCEILTSGNIQKKLILQDTAEYAKVTVMDIRNLDIPCKKSTRNSSSDCSVVEEVIASQTDKVSACVHVALDKWENAEKVLHAKMTENETVPNEKLLQYQPFVRVQKIDNSTLALQNANRRLRSSSSPERKPKAKRAKIMPPSPRSPRKLRAPRGKWYRER